MNPDRPIYKKLLQSYLLFAVIAIIFTIAGASLILSIITKGGANSMLPMRIIGVNGSIQNKDPLMKMGGWIEELSDEHRVRSGQPGSTTAKMICWRWSVPPMLTRITLSFMKARPGATI